MNRSTKQSRSNKSPSANKRGNAAKAHDAAPANDDRLSARLKTSLSSIIIALLAGIILVWLLLRLGTFFLLPVLSSPTQQTVNVSPWWVLGVLMGMALILIALLYAGERFLKIHTPLTWAALALIVAVVCFESFIQIVIPNASLAAWAFFGNTQASRTTYIRQVDATSYLIRYRGMHFNGEVSNAQIANWRCDAEPIKTKMRFTPAFTHHPTCVTVHIGLLGWEWIEDLRACSKNDLEEAERNPTCKE